MPSGNAALMAFSTRFDNEAFARERPDVWLIEDPHRLNCTEGLILGLDYDPTVTILGHRYGLDSETLKECTEPGNDGRGASEAEYPAEQRTSVCDRHNPTVSVDYAAPEIGKELVWHLR